MNGWKKSSFSAENGNCVEVFEWLDGWRVVRDGKIPDGHRLAFTPEEWDAFLKGVKAGEFG